VKFGVDDDGDDDDSFSAEKTKSKWHHIRWKYEWQLQIYGQQSHLTLRVKPKDKSWLP